MKIDGNALQSMNLLDPQNMHAKPREARQNAPSAAQADQASIHFRPQGTPPEALSPENVSQNLDQLHHAGSANELGEVHSNLNMERVWQLLSPVT
jgi:hypothetical protein